MIIDEQDHKFAINEKEREIFFVEHSTLLSAIWLAGIAREVKESWSKQERKTKKSSLISSTNFGIYLGDYN